MAYILLPISLFLKQYKLLSVTLLTEIPFYIYLSYVIIYSLKMNKNKIGILTSFNKRIVIGISLLLALQFSAMLLSFSDAKNVLINPNPIKQEIVLLIFVAAIFIHYFVVLYSIKNENEIEKFLRGVGISLFLVLVIAFFQILYLIFPTVFNPIVRFIGRFLEQENLNSTWYSAGSYIQTVKRVNGLNPESDYLASQLLIVFTPFILSAIKNKFNVFSPKKNYNGSLYYLLLSLIVIVLFSTKSTTGLLAILMIILLLWVMLPKSTKIWSAGALTIFILIFSAYIYWSQNPLFMSFFEHSIVEKLSPYNISTMDRLGGTTGLIMTWIQHPLLGVGWGYHNYYLFSNVPIWTIFNIEFLGSFVPYHFYPILSIFFGWLAEFGLICVAFISFYIYKLLRDFHLFYKKANQLGISGEDFLRFKTLKDAFNYFLSFYLLNSFLSFNWSESIYLIVFFFFIVIRKIYQAKFN